MALGISAVGEFRNAVKKAEASDRISGPEFVNTIKRAKASDYGLCA